MLRGKVVEGRIACPHLWYIYQYRQPWTIIMDLEREGSQTSGAKAEDGEIALSRLRKRKPGRIKNRGNSFCTLIKMDIGS